MRRARAPYTRAVWPNEIRVTSWASSRAHPRPRSRPPGVAWPATNHPDLTGDDPAASRLATRRMAEINDAYAALTRDADRPTAERIGRPRRHAVRARRRPPSRRPAGPEADPPGHRPGRHERRLPAAQPGRRQRRRADAAARPAAEGDRCRRSRAAACLDADRPARRAIGCAISGGRPRPRSRMPRRRSSRSASSTTTRSARSRPSSRRTSTGSPGTVSHDPDLVECGAGHPGRSRPARDRPPDPPDSGPSAATPPDRGSPEKPAGKARSPPDTGRRP